MHINKLKIYYWVRFLRTLTIGNWPFTCISCHWRGLLELKNRLNLEEHQGIFQEFLDQIWASKLSSRDFFNFFFHCCLCTPSIHIFDPLSWVTSCTLLQEGQVHFHLHLVSWWALQCVMSLFKKLTLRELGPVLTMWFWHSRWLVDLVQYTLFEFGLLHFFERWL